MSDNNTLLVEPIVEPTPAIIKAIGVGGGGGNAVSQMYREGIDGVRFLACNTDSKALADVPIPDKLQLGPGLGAGGRPDVGREYAEESVDRIVSALDDGTKMVFITAGMGGGTGTGASPVIAREAKRLGILTVGIVTIPFAFEGLRQIDKALDGLDCLAEEVDALLIINNQRLVDIYADCDVLTAFKYADDTLTTAVRCIVEVITMHGRIGLDFCDAANVLRDGGVAIMSTGYGEGKGRVTKALDDALYSPLLNNNDVYRSRKVILSITTSSAQACALRMDEINEVENFMSKFRSDVETKWGLTLDDSVGDQVKISILASGFKLYEKATDERPADDETERAKAERRRRNYPSLQPNHHNGKRTRPEVFIFSVDDLDNEALVAGVEAQPTAERSSQTLGELCALVKAKGTPPHTAPQRPTGPEEATPYIDFTIGG